VYLILFLMLLKRPLSSWRAVTGDFFLLSLLCLMMASVAWSVAADVTVRRALGVIGTTFFAIYITWRYTPEERLTYLAWALLLNVAANALLLVVHPSLAGSEGYAGIFSHKNTLGRMMSLSTLVFVLTAWVRGKPAYLLCAALSFGLLIVARSSTALVVLVSVLSLIPLFRMLAQDVRGVVVVAIVAILLGGTGLLVAASHTQAVADILGKDVTLTGRTVLWRALVDMIARRPILGYGFNAFWSQEFGAGVSVDGWFPTQAHNGYIDLTLDFGLVGLTLFVAAIARGAARAVRYFRRQPMPANLWPLLYLCFLAMYNASESTNMAAQSLFWMLFATALMSISPFMARTREPAERPDLRLVDADEATPSGSPSAGGAGVHSVPRASVRPRAGKWSR
jgi:O-antigen ligase